MRQSEKLFMMTLALEFSSSQRSVALAEGDSILSETVETGGRGTAAFSMIEKVLAAARADREQIGAICVGLGPGSYTGIRAAISIARGWQLARGIKVAGISSVEAIVTQAQAENIFGLVNVMIDAQRDEFYLAAYEISGSGWNEVGALKIVSSSEIHLPLANKEKIIIGPGAAEQFPGGRNIFPRADFLARLAGRPGRVANGENLEPIYLRETSFVKAARI